MAYDTSYYDKAKEDYKKQAEDAAAKRKTDTESDYNARLKAAYIARQQNQQKLNDNLALAGIRGGTTETSNLKLATNYNGTVNSLNSERANALNNIDTETQQNILANDQSVNTAQQQYIENRESEDRANTREDAQRLDTQNREDWSNYYSSQYSKSYKENDLKKEYKSVYKQYTSASGATKTQLMYQLNAINARLGYLKAHKKGY